MSSGAIQGHLLMLLGRVPRDFRVGCAFNQVVRGETVDSACDAAP